MKSRVTAAIALGVLPVAAFGPTPPRAFAAAAAGSARVVAPDSGVPARSLAMGGSRTTFTLELPAAAECPGDSANDNYRVQSYIVPVAVDPGSLTFGSAGPLPAGTGPDLRQPLYATTSTGYVNAQTANADFRGDTGAIVNIPAFDFAVYEPGNVPAGTYNLGVACTKGPASPAQLVRYWNTTITVAVDPADAPAGITWESTAAGAGASESVRAGADADSIDAFPAAAQRTALVATPPEASSRAAAAEAIRPTGGEPNFSIPALAIPSSVRSPISSGVVVALWVIGLLVATRVAWLSTRRRTVASRHLSVLEGE